MLPRDGFEEKRDFIRMGVSCPATFTRAGDQATYHGVADDLSATGLKITTTQDVAMGEILEVDIRPKAAIVAPLRATVEVVRITPDGASKILGVRVQQMHP